MTETKHRWIIFGNPGYVGASGVVRDDKGNLVFCFGYHVGKTTNNEAELRAIHIGLSICYAMRTNNVEVESDSELVVSWLKEKKKPPISLSNVVEDIKLLLDFVDVDISHTPREGNKMANLWQNREQEKIQVYINVKNR